MTIFVVVPWNLKKTKLKEPLHEWIERLKPHMKLEIIQPPKDITEPQILTQFYQNNFSSILQKGSAFFLVCDEHGSQKTSYEWARDWDKQICKVKSMVIVLGAAYGYPPGFKQFCPPHEILSLSKLTLPHEFACLFVFEQLYRWTCILNNHPYHHGDQTL